MTKRVLSFILACCLVFALFPATVDGTPVFATTVASPPNAGDQIGGPSRRIASGDCGDEGDNVTYTLYDDGTLEIRGNGAMADYNSYSEAPWDTNRSDIKTVIIESGVTAIGYYAFFDCDSLTSVTIGNSVTAISNYAFSSCDSLTSVTIPDSVTSIGGETFSSCGSLARFTVGENNTAYCAVDGVLFSKNQKTLVSYPNAYGTSSYTIPANVTVIGNSAFLDCRNLTSVTIPNSVISIGWEAFSFTGLANVTIPDSVKTIGGSAFASCVVLKSVTIGNSVETIGDYAFNNCNQMTDLTIGNSVTSIGRAAFNYCRSLTSVTIPDSVKTIGDAAFWRCLSMTSVTIGNGVTSIDRSAFNSCDKLTDVYYRGTEAQWGKISIADYNDPLTNTTKHYTDPRTVIDSGDCGADDGNVTYTLYDDGRLVISGSGDMADYAYHGAPWYANRSAVKTVVIISGVTSIGEYAFYDCNGLTSVTIPDSVTSIGYWAFLDCSKLSGFTVSENNPAYCAVDGVLSSKDQKTLVCYPNAHGESYTISNSVTTIGDTAFAGCVDLTNITIGNSVQTIAGSAFADCTGLTSVTIPTSVKTIGVTAFAGCTGLTSITIPGNVTSMSTNVFDHCTGLKDVTILTGVTAISDWTFNHCSSLESVTIPNSIKTIGHGAFANCDKLTDVYYGGDATQWNQITIYDYNEPLTNATIHYTDPRTVIDSGDCGANGGNVTYTLYDDGTLEIRGSGKMADYHIDYINRRVPWYTFRSAIKTVVINSGVTSIGDYAFYDCDSLTSVTIGNSIQIIGNRAFYACNKLTSVTIPDSVTSIGEVAFANCDGLISVTIPDSVTTIGSFAFSNCWSLTDITIPESVTIIGESAFSSCWSLTDVTIPESVTVISTSVFSGCSGLTNITILDSVTTIGDYAFYCCSGLISVSIGNGVKTIGEAAFANCDGLTGVTIPNGVKTISDYAFSHCDSLTDVTIPDSVTTIDNYAFYCCTALTDVNIGNGVKTISLCAFSTCDSLTDIYYNGTAEQWGQIRIDSSNAPLANATKHYTAEEPVTYTVTWVNYDGTVLEMDTGVVSGATPTYDGTTPTRMATAQYSYTFSGWTPEVTAVTGDVTYTATFTETARTYTVTWVNENFRELKVDTLAYGTMPEYNGDTPTKASTAQYSYTFSGWTPAVTAVTGDVTYTATFTPTVRTYTVTWVNEDGKELKKDTVAYDTTPKYEGDTPTKASTAQYSYTFKGWTPAVTAVTGDVTYTATFTQTARTYTVTWVNEDGKELKKDTVAYGATPSYGGSTPTRASDGNYTYTFSGWSPALATVTGNATYTATYTATPVPKTYTVTYDANGGTGTPSPQRKEEGVPLTLSSLTPSKTYVLRYNANRGSVTPASKNVTCTFRNWNTERNGLGNSYAAGGSYTANENITLYAQWTNPLAGELATPLRNGYDFVGWFTSATGGVQITESSTVTENLTLYAHWTQSTNPYNLGDETYSFANYGDSDSPYGHCFGMSMTSAGYYNGLLDIGRIGGNANTPLYSFGRTQTVTQPICYYQSIQGSYSARAIVAGGSFYLNRRYSIASDWQEVVNYVSNHNYDSTGVLQIGFRKSNEGGHAINFLRYEKVNGQDRIYAYDNNFPSRETYFYQDSSGRVWQAPVQTFSGAIDCIALRDCRIYFNSVGDFDATHVLYMAKDAATVQGYTYSYMEGAFSDEEYVMYEIPANQDRVIIIPSRDHADFIYMDTEYSFGEITDETRGELRFASLKEGTMSTEASFQIFEADSVTPTLSVTQLGTTLHYEIENFDIDKLLLLVADYDESGRMLRVQQINPLNQSGDISVEEAVSHRAFLLNRETYTPLCAAWKSDKDGF